MKLQTPFLFLDSYRKNLAKKESLYFAFVDLEKAFDWAPRDVVWWVLRKLDTAMFG